MLRQQVRMLERQVVKPVHPSRIEKLTLAVVTNKLKTVSQPQPQGCETPCWSFNQKQS